MLAGRGLRQLVYSCGPSTAQFNVDKKGTWASRASQVRRGSRASEQAARYAANELARLYVQATRRLRIHPTPRLSNKKTTAVKQAEQQTQASSETGAGLSRQTMPCRRPLAEPPRPWPPVLSPSLLCSTEPATIRTISGPRRWHMPHLHHSGEDRVDLLLAQVVLLQVAQLLQAGKEGGHTGGDTAAEGTLTFFRQSLSTQGHASLLGASFSSCSCCLPLQRLPVSGCAGRQNLPRCPHGCMGCPPAAAHAPLCTVGAAPAWRGAAPTSQV